MDEIPLGDLWSLTTVKSEEEDGVLSALTLIGINRQTRFHQETYGHA
jgi:hypothetical protein